MKNNPVQRIKLLMSYQMGKTLNENLENLPVLNEDESTTDIEEAGGEFGLAKDLASAAKTEKKIAHLAQFFKVGEDVVKLGAAKDLTTLSKDLEKAIAQDIKAGFRGNGRALGENAKMISKQIAIKEILSSQKVLSEQDIIQIINRVKEASKLKSAAVEAKAGAKVVGTAVKDTKKVAGDAKAVEQEVKAAVTDATKQQATGVLETAAKNPENKEIAGILNKSKKVVSSMSEVAYGKLKRVSKFLAAKYIIMLGLAGGGAYLLAKALFGGNTNPEDPKNNLFPKCINDILDDEGTTVGYDGGGAPVVIVKNTGNEEYDKIGGLKFFINNRVVSGDGSKKGYWSCKDGSTLVVKEDAELNEVGGEVTLAQMTDFVDDAVDDLDGYVAVYNLQSLKNILTQLVGKTYKGKNAVQAFMDFYKQDEGGDDFIADVNSVGVRTLGVEGVELKDEVLKLAQGGGSSVGDGNTKTGIGGIDIKWDGGDTNPTPTPNPDPNPKPKKSNFHDCSSKDFPLEFGCVSPKIAEIQGCLGVTPQLGNFGPKTKKALTDLQYDLSKGITIDIYNSVKENCGEPKKERRKLEPIEPIKTPGIKPIDIKMPTLKDLESKIKPLEKTPAEVYQSIKDAGLIIGEDGNNRIKYKGPTPGGDILSKLDTALSDMGYDRIKQLEDVKRYGSKYVWLKR
jgi:hypothetical protein